MSRHNAYAIPQPNPAQTYPRIRREGFFVTSQQPASAPSIIDTYGETSGTSTARTISASSSSTGPSTSAFSHLRHYNSQSLSQSTSATTSSSSSYRAPTFFNLHQGSSDIQETLASLIAQSGHQADDASSFPLSSARHSDSTTTLRGLDHNYQYACSAPIPFGLPHNQAHSASQHHSYDDAFQYQNLLLDHSASSLEIPLSPRTDPSSVFSHSQPSTTYFDDQSPYSFENDNGQSSYFDSSSFASASPSTSLSTSFNNYIDLSKLSPSVQTNVPLRPPSGSSATRSLSRSSTRQAEGKTLSSRSRMVRKDSSEIGAGKMPMPRGRRMSGGKLLGASSSNHTIPGSAAFSSSLPIQPMLRRMDSVSSESEHSSPALFPQVQTSRMVDFAGSQAAEEEAVRETEEEEQVDLLSQLSGPALAAEKRRLKRISHNSVERRRRDHINESIAELANLIPTAILDPRGSSQHAKETPLGLLGSRLGVDMTELLGEAGRDEDLEDEEQHVSMGKGQKKGTKKGKSARLSASGANALGPDGKPNKGLVLSKSVQFIKYLQNIIQVQADRNATLEDSLQSMLISRSPLAAQLALPRPPDPSLLPPPSNSINDRSRSSYSHGYQQAGGLMTANWPNAIDMLDVQAGGDGFSRSTSSNVPQFAQFVSQGNRGSFLHAEQDERWHGSDAGMMDR